MKILEIGLSNNLGGIEHFLFNVYNNIYERDIIIDFVVYSGEMKYSPEEYLDGHVEYHLHHIPSIKSSLKYMYSLYKVCKNGSYDVIHIHKNSLANILPIIIAKISGNAKIIVHSHNTQPGNAKKIFSMIHYVNKVIISKLLLTRIACSKLAGDWMFSNSNYKVIHNAIDIKKFIFKNEVRNQVRREFQLENKFVVGNVGRISKQKNQKFLIEIFREICMQNKAAMLLLIGGSNDYYYQRELELLINKYSLQDKVKFLGVRKDVDKLYQAMDVLIMPSLFEGLCISAIEAQACGLKCICTDVFPEEASVSSENFIKLSLKCDPHTWAEVALDCTKYERKNMYIDMKKAGYDIADEVKKIERLYREK